jgi:RNA polymerase sigma factor (sigma-70 family)
MVTVMQRAMKVFTNNQLGTADKHELITAPKRCRFTNSQVVRISMTQLTNQELIERCRHGDALAWQRLVQRYARLVHSVPVRYGLMPSEVDDIGQEVFLALAQQLHQLVDPESLPAWLLTTARRASWRAMQKRNQEQPLSAIDLTAATVQDTLQPVGARVPSMQELLQGWQRQEALTQGFATLGERCRELLTLIFLDEREPSYDEISDLLGVAKGSIGPSRNRCLQQLRTILEGLGFSAGEA